ncbi:MAG: hypothetical protein MRJ93_09635 [Nitrososphaeraceae archaeon]|nr:hypothetical protein [Nitrososphaeraceae archaeon]
MDYQEYPIGEHLIYVLLRYLSGDIKNRIVSQYVNCFVDDKIIDPFVLSTDSTSVKAKGYLWNNHQ